MIKDRSHEFHEKARRHTNNVNSFDEISVVNVSSEAFFAEVDSIRKLIDLLSADILALKAQQANILAQTFVDDRQKDQLESYVSAIRHREALLKPRLLAMKRDMDVNSRGMSTVRRHGADFRIRKYHVQTLLKKLSELLTMFHDSQMDYRLKIAKRLKRQCDLIGIKLSDADINSILDSNTNSSLLITRTLLPNTAAARAVLEDVTMRHDEIKKLEQSVSELTEMQSDLAVLVETQGEMVDSISHNVEESRSYIEDGERQTHSARAYQKGATRKKVFCVLLFIVVLIIIILALIVMKIVLFR
ncbi:hypothetical protein AB6A40_002859 [Gnathostoma spinigerum]|uniref:t-SNARE coiled-coil homology domain-containing protein n=1 Tax=Gnathostoma spinigerum TaxID=75299 RepID=A0ABD6E901_9BILA